MIDVADRRLDDFRHLRHQRSVRNFFDSLTDDASRLPHLLEPEHISVVGVAVLADRNIEFEIRIRGVGFRFANIPFDTRTAERRSSQAHIDCVLRRDDSNASRTADPYAIFREQRLVLVYLLGKAFEENPHLILKSVVDLILRAADAKHVRRVPRSAVVLENILDILTFADALYDS